MILLINIRYKLIFFICFLILEISFAIPTPEGLFRNLNNKEYTGNTSTVTFTIENINKDSYHKKDNLVQNSSNYIKLFVYYEYNTFKLIQVEYASIKMKEIVRVIYINNLLKRIDIDKNFDRMALYSLVLMYSLNKSYGFMELLKRVNPIIPFNSELINRELSTIYKNKIKNLKSNLANNIDKNINTKVEDNSYFYNSNRIIKLVKKGNKFFWRLKLKKVEGYFTSDKRHLDSISIDLGTYSLDVFCDQYSVVNGLYEFPKNILIMGEHKKVKLRFYSISNFNSTSKKISQIYLKLKNKKINVKHIPSNFLY